MATILNVYRFDPSVDAEPRFESYEVPTVEYNTALMALQYINENIEPIGFDYSCRGSLCGRCACSIDGTPGLACFTVLDEGEHTIEPLAGFPVIKDLLVDKSSLLPKLDASELEVSTVASLKREDLPAIEYEYYWETLERLNMCRECGNCYSVCPVYQQNSEYYAGPAAFGQMALRNNDGLDQRDRVLQAVMGGVFSCMLCGMCSNVCPAGIDHVALHQQFRDQATEVGLIPADAQ